MNIHQNARLTPKGRALLVQPHTAQLTRSHEQFGRGVCFIEMSKRLSRNVRQGTIAPHDDGPLFVVLAVGLAARIQNRRGGHQVLELLDSSPGVQPVADVAFFMQARQLHDPD